MRQLWLLAGPDLAPEQIHLHFSGNDSYKYYRRRKNFIADLREIKLQPVAQIFTGTGRQLVMTVRF
jgi:hypothetical protein